MCRLPRNPLRPTSRERGSITNGKASGNPPPKPEAVDNHPPETTVNAEDPVAGNVRRVRANAITGALGRDNEASWQQPTSRADAEGRESPSHPPKPRGHSRLMDRLQPKDDSRTREHLARAGGREKTDHDLDSRVEGGSGVGSVYKTGAGRERIGTYSGSATSSHADRWDPAVRLLKLRILLNHAVVGNSYELCRVQSGKDHIFISSTCSTYASTTPPPASARFHGSIDQHHRARDIGVVRAA